MSSASVPVSNAAKPYPGGVHGRGDSDVAAGQVKYALQRIRWVGVTVVDDRRT